MSERLQQTVLLVEDEVFVRMVWSTALANAEFRVVESGDGANAYELLRASRPDVLVTDVNLPGVKGDRLAEKAIELGVPALVVTGGAEKPQLPKEVELLRKPLRLQDLVSKVEALVRGSSTSSSRQGRPKESSPAAASIDAALVGWARTAQNAILLADDDQRYVYANEAATRLLGYTNEELLRMTLSDLTPPSNEQEGAALWRAFIAAGEQKGEYEVQLRNGQTRTFRYKAIANIRPGLHLSDLYDVTDLVRAEKMQRDLARHRELMIHEIHHRLQNQLATLESIITLQSRSRPTVPELVSALSGRIQAMGVTNRLLWSEVSTEKPSVGVRALAEEVILPTVVAMAPDPERIQATVSGDPLPISHKNASLLGLLLHEVVANYFEHSRPASGSVHVRVVESGRSLVEIRFSPAFSESPDQWQKGFGLTLVENLAAQLDAEVEWEDDAFRLEFLRASDG